MTVERKVLRWADPPPAIKGGARERHYYSPWGVLARQLRGEPGRWAVIHEGSRMEAFSIHAIIRAGKVKCFEPRGAFESCTRSMPSGDARIYEVYARYVGS
jgi:hypothetical protein